MNTPSSDIEIASGTDIKSKDEILNHLLKFYNLNTRANSDSKYHIYDKICAYANDEIPVLLGLPEHAVVGVGTIKWKITYKETYWHLFKRKTRIITEYETAAVVNSGWGSHRQYSYYPMDYVSNVGYFWQSSDYNIATINE